MLCYMQFDFERMSPFIISFMRVCTRDCTFSVKNVVIIGNYHDILYAVRNSRSCPSCFTSKLIKPQSSACLGSDSRSAAQDLSRFPVNQRLFTIHEHSICPYFDRAEQDWCYRNFGSNRNKERNLIKKAKHVSTSLCEVIWRTKFVLLLTAQIFMIVYIK